MVPASCYWQVDRTTPHTTHMAIRTVTHVLQQVLQYAGKWRLRRAFLKRHHLYDEHRACMWGATAALSSCSLTWKLPGGKPLAKEEMSASHDSGTLINMGKSNRVHLGSNTSDRVRHTLVKHHLHVLTDEHTNHTMLTQFLHLPSTL